MATVTGITVKRADEIAGASVVSGRIVPQTGQLELTKGDGTTQNAGLVVAAAIASWPIGSIFMNATATNPTTLLGGGVWQRWGQGRVPVGVDEAQTEFNVPAKTNSAATKTHILTANEMPAHNHSANTGIQSAKHTHTGTTSTAGAHSHGYQAAVSYNDVHANGSAIGVKKVNTDTGTSGNHNHTVTVDADSVDHTHPIASQGGGEAHNNLQPYITVYMWLRTA